MKNINISEKSRLSWINFCRSPIPTLNIVQYRSVFKMKITNCPNTNCYGTLPKRSLGLKWAFVLQHPCFLDSRGKGRHQWSHNWPKQTVSFLSSAKRHIRVFFSSREILLCYAPFLMRIESYSPAALPNQIHLNDEEIVAPPQRSSHLLHFNPCRDANLILMQHNCYIYTYKSSEWIQTIGYWTHISQDRIFPSNGARGLFT